MQKFANLLDCLTTTPSRNGKLGAAGRIFPRRARSRPRLRAGRAHRRPLPAPAAAPCALRADGRQDRSRALSAVARLRRRHGGDRLAAVARPARRPPLAAPCRGRRGAGAGPARQRRPDHRRLPRPARRARALGAAEAHRRGAARRRLGASRQDGAGADERPRAVRHRGDVARAVPALRGPVRLARQPRTAAQRRRQARLPPADAVASDRGRRLGRAQSR